MDLRISDFGQVVPIITEPQIAMEDEISRQDNQVTSTSPSKISKLLQNNVHSTEVLFRLILLFVTWVA